MEKYINVDELLKKSFRIEGHFDLPGGKAQNFSAIDVSEIINFPTADVAPVVHAYWIKTANTWTHDLNEASKPVYRCSKCGRIEKAQEPFCNCGAKMDGKEDTE